MIETIGKSETYRAFIIGPPGLTKLGVGRQVAAKVGWKYLNVNDWTKKEQEILKVKREQQEEIDRKENEDKMRKELEEKEKEERLKQEEQAKEDAEKAEEGEKADEGEKQDQEQPPEENENNEEEKEAQDQEQPAEASEDEPPVEEEPVAPLVVTDLPSESLEDRMKKIMASFKDEVPTFDPDQEFRDQLSEKQIIDTFTKRVPEYQHECWLMEGFPKTILQGLSLSKNKIVADRIFLIKYSDDIPRKYIMNILKEQYPDTEEEKLTK